MTWASMFKSSSLDVGRRSQIWIHPRCLLHPNYHGFTMAPPSHRRSAAKPVVVLEKWKKTTTPDQSIQCGGDLMWSNQGWLVIAGLWDCQLWLVLGSVLVPVSTETSLVFPFERSRSTGQPERGKCWNWLEHQIKKQTPSVPKTTLLTLIIIK